MLPGKAYIEIFIIVIYKKKNPRNFLLSSGPPRHQSEKNPTRKQFKPTKIHNLKKILTYGDPMN